jgi:hypothetical protein
VFATFPHAFEAPLGLGNDVEALGIEEEDATSCRHVAEDVVESPDNRDRVSLEPCRSTLTPLPPRRGR